MSVRAIIGSAIFLAALAAIIIRPYRLPEAGTALVAGTLMVLGGYVGLGEALAVVSSEWNVYGFFLGLMLISALADQAGVFETLATAAGHWAGGSARRLYLAVFLVGVAITAFLSNDATALILTPLVYALVTRLRLPPLPFMFACTFIADTASFLLPVSNPINVLVVDAFGGGLGLFWRYLLLPSLCCIALNVILFTWIFRRDLRLRYEPSAIVPAALRPARLFRMTLLGLGLICAGYLLASALALPLSLVALAGGGLLLAVARATGRVDWRRLRGDISWPVFGFITGMFVLVRGVENLGLTALVGQGLLRAERLGSLPAVLIAAGGMALGANLINNVPAALVMVAALRSLGPLSGASHALVYATILGADLGPNLTTVGSLATMLWLLLLRRKGLEISTIDYLRLGLTIVPAMLLIGGMLIWLRL